MSKCSFCSFCSFYFLIIFSFINLQNYSLADTTKLCEGKLKENSYNVIDNKKPDLIEIRVDNNSNTSTNKKATVKSMQTTIAKRMLGIIKWSHGGTKER